MAYDGLTMLAVCRELQDRLVNGKIDKIYQPTGDTIIIYVRQRTGERFKLLLSARAYEARIHLTGEQLENPLTPPLFCMVLRKNLDGGKIMEVSQNGLERQLIFKIQAFNEFREIAEKHLICEVMGKHSNIILVNPENNKIIDAIKRYTHAVNRYREMLPGREYSPPPPQNKLDPREVTEEKFRELLLKQPLQKPVVSGLLNFLAGISPLIAKELVARAGLPEEITVNTCGEYELNKLWQTIQDLASDLKAGLFKPTLVQDAGSFIAFSSLDLNQFTGSGKKHPLSVNETIDLYFQEQHRKQQFTHRQNQLKKIIKKELDRCLKKASLQESTIKFSQEAQEFKVKGELLTANLFQIQQGASQITVTDFYSPINDRVTIELFPELSPSENAQRYFKQYNKAKNAARKATEQHKQTEEEIRYLQSVMHDLENTETPEALEEIAQELSSQGYLAENPAKTPKVKNKVTAQIQFAQAVSSDGYQILVGRNNRQNDYLTLKIAKDNDLWLHVKDLAGSHVIIKNPLGQPVPVQTISEAAALAAYYSKGRYSSKVPVDYTEKKHVRKPSGAKPGMVIYNNQQTIFITPDENHLRNLLQTTTTTSEGS